MDWNFSDGGVGPEGPRPLPPYWVESGKFSFNDSVLLYDGIGRADPRELKLLFRKNASSGRRNAATKKWMAAQLALYGVDFAKGARVGVLWDKLAAAVRERQVSGEMESSEGALRGCSN